LRDEISEFNLLEYKFINIYYNILGNNPDGLDNPIINPIINPNISECDNIFSKISSKLKNNNFISKIIYLLQLIKFYDRIKMGYDRIDFKSIINPLNDISPKLSNYFLEMFKLYKSQGNDEDKHKFNNTFIKNLIKLYNFKFSNNILLIKPINSVTLFEVEKYYNTEYYNGDEVKFNNLGRLLKNIVIKYKYGNLNEQNEIIIYNKPEQNKETLVFTLYDYLTNYTYYYSKYNLEPLRDGDIIINGFEFVVNKVYIDKNKKLKDEEINSKEIKDRSIYRPKTVFDLKDELDESSFNDILQNTYIRYKSKEKIFYTAFYFWYAIMNQDISFLFQKIGNKKIENHLLIDVYNKAEYEIQQKIIKETTQKKNIRELKRKAKREAEKEEVIKIGKIPPDEKARAVREKVRVAEVREETREVLTAPDKTLLTPSQSTVLVSIEKFFEPYYNDTKDKLKSLKQLNLNKFEIKYYTLSLETFQLIYNTLEGWKINSKSKYYAGTESLNNYPLLLYIYEVTTKDKIIEELNIKKDNENTNVRTLLESIHCYNVRRQYFLCFNLWKYYTTEYEPNKYLFSNIGYEIFISARLIEYSNDKIEDSVKDFISLIAYFHQYNNENINQLEIDKYIKAMIGTLKKPHKIKVENIFNKIMKLEEKHGALALKREQLNDYLLRYKINSGENMYQFGLNNNMEQIEKYKASINTKNREGNTALHGIIENGHLDSIKKFEKFGADFNIKNNQNYTPLLKFLTLYEQNKHEIYKAISFNKFIEIMQNFIYFGAKIEDEDKKYVTKYFDELEEKNINEDSDKIDKLEKLQNIRKSLNLRYADGDLIIGF